MTVLLRLPGWCHRRREPRGDTSPRNLSSRLLRVKRAAHRPSLCCTAPQGKEVLPSRPCLALSAEDAFAVQWASLRSRPRPVPVPVATEDGLSTLYDFMDLPDAFETRSTCEFKALFIRKLD